jgi:hypothetical protein
MQSKSAAINAGSRQDKLIQSRHSAEETRT